MEARDSAGLDDVSIVRIEQLYPFPGEALAIRLKRMTNLETVVWAQEEPRNNGAWFFVESLIEESLDEAGHKGMRPRRSEEHTSELQSLMRTSYAVFCLKKKTTFSIHIAFTSTDH